MEILIATDKENDPLFNFKAMYEEDLESLKKAISDYNNKDTLEIAKLQLYKDITAKYHAYVPKLGEGLYGYFADQGFYDEVSRDSLFHNLRQIYNKLISFKVLGYPALKETIPQNTMPMVNITNTNENRIYISISFNDVRKKIEH